MIKYPIGIQSFEQIIEDGYLYVDKTALVYKLVKTGKVYFLSRPRRFGKSLLISTLDNYFRGRKELFRGLAMEELEKDWFEYPVFHLDFNSSVFSREDELDKKLNYHIGEWEKKYDLEPVDLGFGDRLVRVLKAAHHKTGRRCVVLVDEYDKPILDVLDTGRRVKVGLNEMLQEEWHREILKGFYSCFKEADGDLEFVLLTGVTKFSQVSVFSGFNQPADISMVADYEALCGITQEELEHYFAEPIRELATHMNVDDSEMIRMLKAKYDGYHFSPAMTAIYTTLSAFSMPSEVNSWTTTGSVVALLLT